MNENSDQNRHPDSQYLAKDPQTIAVTAEKKNVEPFRQCLLENIRMQAQGNSISYVEVESAHEFSWFITAPVPIASSLMSIFREKFQELEVNILTSDIDWADQGKSHSPFWSNEHQAVLIPTHDGSHLILESGEAFGDGSHETTQLMLRYIPSYVKGRYVIDIGSGNGILALFSRMHGAESAIGIEIDPQALQLSIANNRKNGLDVVFVDAKSPSCRKEIDRYIQGRGSHEYVILMNMTIHDMRRVLPLYESLFEHASAILLSGILQEQQEQARALFKRFQTATPPQIDQEGNWIVLALGRTSQ